METPRSASSKSKQNCSTIGGSPALKTIEAAYAALELKKKARLDSFGMSSADFHYVLQPSGSGSSSPVSQGKQLFEAEHKVVAQSGSDAIANKHTADVAHTTTTTTSCIGSPSPSFTPSPQKERKMSAGKGNKGIGSVGSSLDRKPRTSTPNQRSRSRLSTSSMDRTSARSQRKSSSKRSSVKSSDQPKAAKRPREHDNADSDLAELPTPKKRKDPTKAVHAARSKSKEALRARKGDPGHHVTKSEKQDQLLNSSGRKQAARSSGSSEQTSSSTKKTKTKTNTSRRVVVNSSAPKKVVSASQGTGTPKAASTSKEGKESPTIPRKNTTPCPSPASSLLVNIPPPKSPQATPNYSTKNGFSYVDKHNCVKLCVRNLPVHALDTKILEFFQQKNCHVFGKINLVYNYDPKNPKSKCFLTMHNEDAKAVRDAAAQDELNMDGNRLKVSEAPPRENQVPEGVELSMVEKALCEDYKESHIKFSDTVQGLLCKHFSDKGGWPVDRLGPNKDILDSKRPYQQIAEMCQELLRAMNDGNKFSGERGSIGFDLLELLRESIRAREKLHNIIQNKKKGLIRKDNEQNTHKKSPKSTAHQDFFEFAKQLWGLLCSKQFD